METRQPNPSPAAPHASQGRPSSTRLQQLVRRRGEEEGIAAAAGEAPLQVAQADAAGDAAAAGASAGDAGAAAEPSAIAGAGAPVIAAAGLGGGGTAAIAGAGALGLAAAGGGGGGGGDTTSTPTTTSTSTSSTPTSSSTTTSPTPTSSAATGDGTSTTTSSTTSGSTSGPVTTTTPQSPSTTATPTPPASSTGATSTQPISTFADYESAVAASGSAGPVAPVEWTSGSAFDVHGGSFTRSVLIPPLTLSELRSQGVMDYALSVDGSTSARVGEGGLRVVAQPGTGATINAHAEFNGGTSNLLWMQNLAITGSGMASGVRSSITVSASASGQSMEGAVQTGPGAYDMSGVKPPAEVAVQHVSVTQAGTGVLHSEADLFASATNALPGASVHVGDLAVAATADDAYAESTRIEATAPPQSSAFVTIDGDASYVATGRIAHTGTQIYAHSADLGTARIDIGGNVVLDSQGTDQGVVRAVLHSSVAHVTVDGHLQATAQGSAGTIQLQLASDYGGTTSVGGIDVHTGTGAAHVFLDIYADTGDPFGYGRVTTGDLTMDINGSSDAVINVNHANDATAGVVGDGFVAHGSSMGVVTLSNATFTGTGVVHMNLDGGMASDGSYGTVQMFHTIDQGDLSLLDLHFQMQDQDASLSTTAMTTIRGFSGAHDAVSFNGEVVNDTTFWSAGHFSTLAALDAGLNESLDATTHYVFAVYDGTEDLNRNGIADDQGSGVLAWDGDGQGMTTVLALPGVTTMAPSDLA